MMLRQSGQSRQTGRASQSEHSSLSSQSIQPNHPFALSTIAVTRRIGVIAQQQNIPWFLRANGLHIGVVVVGCAITTPACSALTAPPGEDPTALTSPPDSQVPTTNLVTDLIPPTKAPKVLVRRILIAYKGADGAAGSVTRSETAAKQLAGSIRKKLIDKTADFAGLAQTHSDAPEGHEGGLLPAFDHSASLDPALIQAAFNTQVQQISEVFATPQGYTVLQRLD